MPDSLDYTLTSSDGQIRAWWSQVGDFVSVNALTIRYHTSKGVVTNSFADAEPDTCTSVGELICAESILYLPRPLEITRVNDTIAVIRGYTFWHPLGVIHLWILDGDKLHRVPKFRSSRAK